MSLDWLTWKKHPNSTQKGLSQDLNQELSHHPITNLRFVPKTISQGMLWARILICTIYDHSYIFFTITLFAESWGKFQQPAGGCLWVTCANVVGKKDSSHDNVKVPSEVCYPSHFKKNQRLELLSIWCFYLYLFFFLCPCLLRSLNIF